jgi:hypothetical protein
MMDGVKFQTKAGENGLITDLLIGGDLVIENSQYIKKELVGVGWRLSKTVKITIAEVIDIDLSFIQLLMAFMRQLNELKIDYEIVWNLEDEQKMILNNVGLNNEIFLNN